MDLSPHKIKRINEFIQSEVNYYFLNPGYTNAFNDDKFYLSKITKNLNEFALIVY